MEIPCQREHNTNRGQEHGGKAVSCMPKTAILIQKAAEAKEEAQYRSQQQVEGVGQENQREKKPAQNRLRDINAISQTNEMQENRHAVNNFVTGPRHGNKEHPPRYSCNTNPTAAHADT